MDYKYLAMNGFQKFWYNICKYFNNLPTRIRGGLTNIGRWFVNLGRSIATFFGSLWRGIREGSWKTRLSYIVMGTGCIFGGQIVRGVTYLGIEIIFVLFMVYFGIGYLNKFSTLGDTLGGGIFDSNGMQIGREEGDNSLLILLFGILTIMVIIGFVAVYFKNIKNAIDNDTLIRNNQQPEPFKADIKSMLDKNFHTTLLFFPAMGVCLFVILPLIFMILVAFTNYDGNTQPPGSLFTWVGLENFESLFTAGASADSVVVSMGETFWKVLGWTMLWAVLSTVTTYIGGIILALMINKKGICGKKIYRNIFVLTIAVPQFISLLVVAQMFGNTSNNLINSLMIDWGWIAVDKPVQFLNDKNLARTMVIIINMWIGLPYTMLSMSGILMNIPSDLYEAARIDGANAFKMFVKITLPYMLVVTGPYLITQFIGNINNFSVIFLLTGGNPANSLELAPGAGETDLLITWLYNITVNNTKNPNYKLGSVIGILVFAVCSIISLFAYKYVGSQEKEEVFQ